MYKKFGKGTLDFVLSLTAILILSPFFLLFTPIAAIAMRGNPFFVQPRPGKNGKIFKMIKYRTMTNAKDKNGDLLPDEKRLTKFGKIMRKLSIDELPELFNILAGQMSVVGPRPLLVQYLPLYNDFQARRHEMRPGLTGLAQVSGRNAITWEEKFEKDVYYVDHASVWLDIKILFMTVGKVFRSEGISQNGHATMEYFTGTASENAISNEVDTTVDTACNGVSNANGDDDLERDGMRLPDETEKGVCNCDDSGANEATSASVSDQNDAYESVADDGCEREINGGTKNDFSAIGARENGDCHCRDAVGLAACDCDAHCDDAVSVAAENVQDGGITQTVCEKSAAQDEKSIENRNLSKNACGEEGSGDQSLPHAEDASGRETTE